MSEIRLDNISKSFKHVEAVKNVSFTVKDGEFVVLLGPTGAGKTTTLRLIAGLEKADGGSIFINEKNVTTLQPAQRDVAFVFQQYSLYPRYTVYDNLAFPLRSPLRGFNKAKIDEAVRQVAETLHIEDKLQNKATQLSGGEMQRVAIGRALVRDPNIFLMDEPLSSLDAKLREELRLELKNIQVKLGATILFVTHDHIEATTMADHIGVLKEGELVQFDSPDQIYNNPNSIYVAQKLGSPKINVISTKSINSAAPDRAAYAAFRPENVILGSTGSFKAEIETIQNLGVDQIVSLKYKNETIRALVKPDRPLNLKATVNFDILEEDILYFAKNTERVYL